MLNVYNHAFLFIYLDKNQNNDKEQIAWCMARRIYLKYIFYKLVLFNIFRYIFAELPNFRCAVQQQ